MLSTVREENDHLSLDTSPMNLSKDAMPSPARFYQNHETNQGQKSHESASNDIHNSHNPSHHHHNYNNHNRLSGVGVGLPTPQFKTPGKYGSNHQNHENTPPHKHLTTSSPMPGHQHHHHSGQHQLQHQHQHHHPQHQHDRLSTGCHGTPATATGQGHIYNPFEVDTLTKLTGPMFSPNVFTGQGTSTPMKSEGTFVWSIDERAVLFPAEIDNMPHHQEHLTSIGQDAATEREAQAAIEEFFSSSQHFVPSPWIPDSEQRKSQSSHPTPCRSTPGPSLRVTRLKKSAKEVGCQTSLSIPMDFDLTSVLGSFHNEEHSECDDSDVKVVLSTSGTLRRKLFQHHVPSPVRPSHGSQDRENVSPPSPHHDHAPFNPSPHCDHAPFNPSPHRDHAPFSPSLCRSAPFSPLATPSSTQFSSSPIQSLSSGRMSSSPGYSGHHHHGAHTGHHHQGDSGRRHQISSRLFPQRESGEFVIGPPSDGMPSPLSSPDISPIKFSRKNSPAEKTNQPSLGSKFRDRLDADSSFDSEPEDLHSMMDCTDMETSQSHSPESNRQSVNWGLSTIRESIDNDDVIDTSRDVISSDTGYQTGSIQDSQHHTNLTQQMSHLPIDSAHQSFLENSPRNSGVSKRDLSRELNKVARAPLRTIIDNIEGF